MVRVGPEATDAALARPGTRVFDMTGRPMRGVSVYPQTLTSPKYSAQDLRELTDMLTAERP